MKRKKFFIINLIAWLIGLVWLIPFIGVFMTAVRPLDELLHGWWNFESVHFTFKNFSASWNHSTAPLSKGIINSLKVAIPSTVFPIIIATMAGYYFSRYRFFFKKTLFILIII